MADLNTITKAELIKDLPAQTSIGATDLYLLQTSVQSFKLQHSDLVANLVDNTTIETNSNKLRIKDDAVGLTKLADINASTTGKVIGKTSGSGDPELIDIDTDLTNVSATHDTIPSALAVTDFINTILLTTVSGQIDDSGSIIYGSGFTSSRLSAGRYTITLPNVAGKNWIVTANAHSLATSGDNINMAPHTVEIIQTNSYTIELGVKVGYAYRRFFARYHDAKVNFIASLI